MIIPPPLWHQHDGFLPQGERRLGSEFRKPISIVTTDFNSFETTTGLRLGEDAKYFMGDANLGMMWVNVEAREYDYWLQFYAAKCLEHGVTVQFASRDGKKSALGPIDQSCPPGRLAYEKHLWYLLEEHNWNFVTKDGHVVFSDRGLTFFSP